MSKNEMRATRRKLISENRNSRLIVKLSALKRFTRFLEMFLYKEHLNLYK